MIKPKLKKCSGCHKDKYLWSSIPPRCKDCHNKSKYSDKEEKPKVKKIAQFSDKRKKELALYRTERDIYMAHHKECEAKLKVCTFKSTALHHRQNRTSNLRNQETWMALCNECHRHIHEVLSMDEAVELNLMFYRN